MLGVEVTHARPWVQDAGTPASMQCPATASRWHSSTSFAQSPAGRGGAGGRCFVFFCCGFLFGGFVFVSWIFAPASCFSTLYPARLFSTSLRILSSPHLRLTRQGRAAKAESKRSVSERTMCWGQPRGPALRLCAPGQTSAARGHHRQQEKPAAEGSRCQNPGMDRPSPPPTWPSSCLPGGAARPGRRSQPSPRRAFRACSQGPEVCSLSDVPHGAPFVVE